MNNDDIVKRLFLACLSLHEAANEIERLRNELQESEKLVAEYRMETADRTRWNCCDRTPSDIEAHEIRGDLAGGNP